MYELVEISNKQCESSKAIKKEATWSESLFFYRHSVRGLSGASCAKYIDLFLDLPSIIYNGDKNYIPERKAETVSWLSGKHKCAGFLKQKNLLVLRSGSPAARGIAFINTIGSFGSIGFLEFLEDLQAVSLLVDGARDFFRENGIGVIFAPMNGSIWSSYRLMTKGFEDKPFLGEPYNKAYYSALLMKCGFKTAKKWETQFVKKVSAKGGKTDKYLEIEKSQRSKGIKIRRMQKFDTDIRIIHKIVMNSFSNFYLFHELDEQSFVDIYADMKLICNKRTVRIAYSPKNRPVGFGIALPDYRNKLAFLSRYAKRYIFLYLGTLQENGVSLYPQCGKAIIISILRSLFWRRKGYICAMMSEDSKTRGFSDGYQKLHEYALFELEAEL